MAMFCEHLGRMKHWLGRAFDESAYASRVRKKGQNSRLEREYSICVVLRSMGMSGIVKSTITLDIGLD